MQDKNSQFAINVINRLKSAFSIDKEGGLAEYLGVKPNTISAWKSRNTVDFSLVIAKCEERGVNLHWLFTGEGEISPQAQSYINTQAQLQAHSENNRGIVKEPDEVYNKRVIQPVAVTVDTAGRENIVFVDVKAAAGYPSNIAEPSFFKRLPAFTLPTRQFANGTFRMFQVDGDSMDDTLRHGEWVVGRFLEDFEGCKNGYTYIIVTIDSVVFKRVLNRVKERGTLVLQSDNPAYRPYEVNIADILEIWDIKAAVIFDLTNKRLDLIKTVNNLIADMVEVKADIKKIEGLI